MLSQVLTLTQGQVFREDVVGVVLTALERWGQQQGSSNHQEQEEGQQEGQEDEEEELDPQLSTALQQLADMSMSTGEAPAAKAADHEDDSQSATPEQHAAAAGGGGGATEGQSREYQQLLEGLGRVVKAAVTGPSCGAAAWEALRRWYLLQGEVRSAQEAALKEVRRREEGGWERGPGRLEHTGLAGGTGGSLGKMPENTTTPCTPCTLP